MFARSPAGDISNSPTLQSARLNYDSQSNNARVRDFIAMLREGNAATIRCSNSIRSGFLRACSK